ncbi:MAG: xanthine dehydrogenase small subunit [Bacteroidales bacterium]
MKETQNHIRFLLGDELIILDFAAEGLSPTLTVLNWLRNHRGLTGVKEGCAEGDCGACTVVLAEPDNEDGLTYRPVNSCLTFLPALHGKQLITVHHLAQEEKNEPVLHPVQKVMVENDGIQCGFCTPGITMSLFALFKNSRNPDRAEVETALAGNLCRCTGYLPIVKSAQEVCDGSPDLFSKNENEVAHTLKVIRNQSTDIFIEDNKQKYFRPVDLSSALGYVADNPDTLVINGASDIALRQTKKFEQLTHILDLSGIDELKQIRRTAAGWEAGAGVTIESLTQIAGGEIAALQQTGRLFGSRQIRETATIGGNLGTASPIGDLLPFLIASKATAELTSLSGSRTLGIEEWITGYRSTALKPGELLTKVVIPVIPGIRFYKVSKRRDVDISSVSGGFRIELEEGKVKDICLAFGGMAATPKRAVITEQSLRGKPWSLETVREAAAKLSEDFQPISDARNSSSYRLAAAEGLLLKFYYDTHE